MTDINREAAGRAIMPVLDGLYDLVETLDEALIMAPEIRQQYAEERRILRERIARVRAYFAPAQQEE